MFVKITKSYFEEKTIDMEVLSTAENYYKQLFEQAKLVSF
jgi:hypothetical protein